MLDPIPYTSHPTPHTPQPIPYALCPTPLNQSMLCAVARYPTMPSVDMFGIFLALQRCSAVTLFGFAREPRYGIQRNYFNGADLNLTFAGAAARAAAAIEDSISAAGRSRLKV